LISVSKYKEAMLLGMALVGMQKALLLLLLTEKHSTIRIGNSIKAVDINWEKKYFC